MHTYPEDTEVVKKIFSKWQHFHLEDVILWGEGIKKKGDEREKEEIEEKENNYCILTA